MVHAKIEKNIIYLLTASCFTNISLFLVNILLINNLSKTDFGIFTLLVSIVYMFIAFSELGISQGTIKYVSEHHALGNSDYIRTHIRTFFAVTLIISLLFLLLFYLSMPLWRLFYSYISTGNAALLGLIILPYPVVRYWNAITDGFQNMRYALFFSIVREPVKLIFLLLAVLFLGLSIKTAAIVFVIASYTTLLCSYGIYRVFISRRDIPFEMEINRSVLFDRDKMKFFSYLYVAFLIFWIQPNILYLVIGRFSEPQSVAAFSACFILNNVMWVFLLPVMDTLFPFISSVSTDKALFEAAKKKIYYALFIAVTSAFLWVLFVYFIGEWVLMLFYGKTYAIYKNIFYLLSISLFFDSFRVLFDPMLKGTKHAKILLYLELARIIGLIILGPFSVIHGGITYLCYLLIILGLIVNFLKGYLLGRYFSINLLWCYIYGFCLFLVLLAL